jgi:hypothetical protein
MDRLGGEHKRGAVLHWLTHFGRGVGRVVIAVLAFILGLLPDVHAIGPSRSCADDVVAPAFIDVVGPSSHVFLAAYRANGPPNSIVILISAATAVEDRSGSSRRYFIAFVCKSGRSARLEDGLYGAYFVPNDVDPSGESLAVAWGEVYAGAMISTALAYGAEAVAAVWAARTAVAIVAVGSCAAMHSAVAVADAAVNAVSLSLTFSQVNQDSNNLDTVATAMDALSIALSVLDATPWCPNFGADVSRRPELRAQAKSLRNLSRSLKSASGSAGKVMSKVWPKHHPWPKYLGGLTNQTLKKLPPNLHYLFHSALDKWNGGMLGRTKSKACEEMVKSDPGQIIRELAEFYEKAENGAFKKYLPDFWQAVEETLNGGL